MTTTLNPYVAFGGKCREAMEFYKQCIGGELTFMTVKGSPIEAQCPEGIHGQILHSMLKSGDMVLMGTDMSGTGEVVMGTAMAISVSCGNEEEIGTFYKKLSEGGEIIDALKVQFWGALFAVLKDKYGVVWMLNYDEHQQ